MSQTLEKKAALNSYSFRFYNAGAGLPRTVELPLRPSHQKTARRLDRAKNSDSVDVCTSSLNLYGRSEAGSRPEWLAEGQSHHHRDAGESFVRQLLWGSPLCSRQPLSLTWQITWRLCTGRPCLRGWVIVSTGRFRQPTLFQLKPRR